MKSLVCLLLMMASFESISETYKTSDHYNGKTFLNPGQNDLKSFWQVLKWKMTNARVDWPETVPNKNFPMRPLGLDEKVSATWINHSTFLLQFPGLNVLTDPVYSDRTSPFSWAGPKRVREPGIPFDVLPKIDVVLISHNHYDHLDLETIQRLDAKFHPLFLVSLGDEKLLKKAGVQNVKAMDWWEEVRVRDLRFIFAPSQHWSARSLWDKNESLWGSFMIDSGATKVYFAGDSGYGPHFLDIKSRLGAPDLALLPIGAYKPQWFMRFHHMNPEDAVKAHLDLGANRSIAMHYGTFQLSDEGIDEPERDLKIAREQFQVSEDKFTILEQGQGLSY
ncbi:MBL fold metallo-hydrolase [Peredibacter starrii]|uniref:MBL fold metallo-hydrolase n=1 Tax=Peredibacter starrii TaxID=28202 RepID=A0AAX4HKZ1_9BACT|nr:MBL fold metallo-hydrolase [Peredibacter starrii]WPU63919.1 MBL fold metallo-hydrolase [Peredibacter starrii]